MHVLTIVTQDESVTAASISWVIDDDTFAELSDRFGTPIAAIIIDNTQEMIERESSHFIVNME